MDGSAKLPPPAPVGITELKNNFASIAKRVHDTSVPCTVLKQGRAYVAIVPVDPGYRTMGIRLQPIHEGAAPPVHVLPERPRPPDHVRAPPAQRGLRRHRAARSSRYRGLST